MLLQEILVSKFIHSFFIYNLMNVNHRKITAIRNTCSWRYSMWYIITHYYEFCLVVLPQRVAIYCDLPSVRSIALIMGRITGCNYFIAFLCVGDFMSWCRNLVVCYYWLLWTKWTHFCDTNDQGALRKKSRGVQKSKILKPYIRETVSLILTIFS